MVPWTRPEECAVWFAWTMLDPALAGFVDVTPDGLDAEGPKETGATFFDWDGDGDWDLITAGPGGEARLFRNDGAGLSAWTDVTAASAPDLRDGTVPRGLLVADLTHDGWPDVVRVGGLDVDVLISAGPPSYALSPGFHLDFPVELGGFEGAAVLDATGDGWLDVLVSGSSVANYLLTNPADGTADLDVADQAPLGMTLSATASDFVGAADWDEDGDPDVVVRGAGAGPDAFLRVPGGWDALGLDIDASNDAKGAVLLCDIRSTGALDLLWTAPYDPKLRHYVWDGVRWEAIWADEELNSVRSAACGDVDNDGHLDLWLADWDYDHLLWGPELWHDHVGAYGVTSIATALADVDNDGDLDAYQIREDGRNTLLENTLSDDRWLQVTLLAQVAACPSAPVHRADVGGWARATRVDGTPVSSRTELSGGFGRGQVAWPVLHLGGLDPAEEHRLEVGFAYGGDPRPIVLRVPAGVHRMVVASDDPDGDGIRTEHEAVDGRVDTDGDGLVDWADDDADGDGIGDAEERGPGGPCDLPIDTDGDGLPDAVDRDSDDDGIDDAVDPDRDGEAPPDGTDGPPGTEPPADSDGDGVVDAADPAPLDAGGVRGEAPAGPGGCGVAPGPGGAAAWVALGVTGWRRRSGRPRRGLDKF